MQPVEQRHLPVVRLFILSLALEHLLLILVIILLTTLWSLAVPGVVAVGKEVAEVPVVLELVLEYL